MQDIYQTFEFYKIKEKISEYSKSELGQEYIANLTMFSSSKEMNEALLDLNEMMSINIRFGPVPISLSANALKIIDLAKKTALLTPRDLNLIAEDVLTSQNVIKFFKKIDLSYERSKAKIANFFDLSNLAKEIHRVITNSLTIADDASPELKAIRRDIKKAEATLQQRVLNLSFNYQKYLNDDNATIRDGHFVLPVKTSDKSKVPGIIYDVSDSGNTTFIEPMEIVQLNNEITSLKVSEHEEERKILKAMTALVLLQESEIIRNNLIIADLDFLQAKSFYGNEIDAIVPTYSETPFVELVKARHPLIKKEKVISNDFHLDEEKRIIVISGPNAGGKTVSLKTVGLLVLMHQSGLAIPAFKATLSYFPHIYIDIGDNQSLSDNLSTFSAHVSQIGEIIKAIKGKDLILLDELGTGTDPKEGEAFAYAVTRFIESKHSFAMISSHFNALKEYAFVSKNIANASMVFDEEKLLPTYRFRQGSPGHSYALSVASRYGVPQDILDNAKEFLEGNEKNDASILLDTLQRKLDEASKLEERLEKENKSLNDRIKKLEIDEENLKTKREKLLETVEEEKRQIIANAKEEVKDILSKLSKDGTKLHEIIELKKQLEDLETNPETVIYNEEIKTGDYVSLPSLNMSGRVVRINGKKAHINSDSGMSFDIEINKLHKIDAPKSSVKVRRNKDYDIAINTSVGLELNIIGLHVDEALDRVTKYLDNCRIKHLTQVRIIHGFGSGALRKAVHQYLDTQKGISFRLGDANEGGGGATVVTLK